MTDPAWYPWRGAIAERLLAVDFVRWDRLVPLENVIRIYGWIDRGDDRSDFVVLDAYLYPGPKISVAVLTSSSDRSEELCALLEEPSEEHVDCERVEEHFGTLAGLNVVRLPEDSPYPPPPKFRKGDRVRYAHVSAVVMSTAFFGEIDGEPAGWRYALSQDGTLVRAFKGNPFPEHELSPEKP